MRDLSLEGSGASMAGSAEAPERARLLIVEDEPDLADAIRAELEAGGHPVLLADTVEGGLAAARTGEASALVVDRMLKEGDGLQIIETLRSQGSLTPVIVISAMATVDDRIVGLKAGGDDYLIKPFDLRELAARVEALLRRKGDPRATRLQVGDLELDLVDRRVRCRGRTVDLLPREFKLLEYFMRRPGQVVTRAMLLEDVWNLKFMAQTNVVDVQIGNLRRKLDPASERWHIVNVRSVGFKLNADV
jgi:two-component system OmpR family response regulator